MKTYPTIARIALDVIPCQASSVPCERVFSAAKLIAADRRARLGAETFEQLQILKHVWRPELVDYAKMNSEEVDHVMLREVEDLLAAEVELQIWDKEDESAAGVDHVDEW